MAEQQMQPGQQPQQGASQIEDLLNTLNSGLGILTEVLAEANPQLAKEAQALKSGYDALVEKMTGAGSAPKEAEGQMPMNQGATGVPANPAMR